jgi:hypothetical protein
MMITGHDNDFYAVLENKERCTNCGHRIERYPFLHWHGTPDILFCGKCCHEIKAGFAADLINVAATVELQALCPAYRSHSFTRQDISRPVKRTAVTF